MAVTSVLGLILGGVALGAASSLLAPKPSSSDVPGVSADTGAVTDDEAKKLAAKRLFRSGIISTSPTGIGGSETIASTRLR